MLRDHCVGYDISDGRGGPLVVAWFLTPNQLPILPGGLISRPLLRFYLQMQLSVLDEQCC